MKNDATMDLCVCIIIVINMKERSLMFCFVCCQYESNPEKLSEKEDDDDDDKEDEESTAQTGWNPR